MTMLTSIRGLTAFLPFGGVRGEGASHLSNDLVQSLSRQFPSLTPDMLSRCIASKTRSKFEGCRWDIEILDAEGKVVAHGREFGAERPYFWLA